MKHYFSLVNTSIPLGRGLNALVHTAMGIGHRIPNNQMPNITVLFADEKTIREFRQEAHKLLLAHTDETAYSDFTHTMTVGSTDNCVKTTQETPENQRHRVKFLLHWIEQDALTGYESAIILNNTVRSYLIQDKHTREIRIGSTVLFSQIQLHLAHEFASCVHLF